MTTLQWPNAESAERWVSQCASTLTRPSVILLSGTLGAGKTQVVKWFVKALGGGELTSSPTFAIHQQYAVTGGLVDHVDLYRLQSDVDLESSGFWDLLGQPEGLVFVEWAERLPETVWPKDWTKIFLSLAKSDAHPELRLVTLRTVPAKRP